MIAWTLARSRLARAIQTGEPADVIDQHRRLYVAARLAHLIRQALPDLRLGDRAELARLLTSAEHDAMDCSDGA